MCFCHRKQGAARKSSTARSLDGDDPPSTIGSSHRSGVTAHARGFTSSQVSHVARPLLWIGAMAKPQELSTIPVEELNDVTGARGKVLIEGFRKLYNAGVVAWQVLNPSHTPPPRI